VRPRMRRAVHSDAEVLEVCCLEDEIRVDNRVRPAAAQNHDTHIRGRTYCPVRPMVRTR
jgi:hypothetical protein